MALPPGVYFQLTAAPGIFGDLLTLAIVFVDGAPDYAASVDAGGTAITLTIGTTAGITSADWATIAADFNADPTVNFLGSMEGEAGNNDPSFAAGPALLGGSAGLGAGQFYSAAPAPAPAEIEVDVVFVGVVRFMIREVPT